MMIYGICAKCQLKSPYNSGKIIQRFGGSLEENAKTYFGYI